MGWRALAVVGGEALTEEGVMASDVNMSRCSWERSFRLFCGTLGHFALLIGTLRFGALHAGYDLHVMLVLYWG